MSIEEEFDQISFLTNRIFHQAFCIGEPVCGSVEGNVRHLSSGEEFSKNQIL